MDSQTGKLQDKYKRIKEHMQQKRYRNYENKLDSI